jgi:uncharacterized protein
MICREGNVEHAMNRCIVLVATMILMIAGPGESGAQGSAETCRLLESMSPLQFRKSPRAEIPHENEKSESDAKSDRSYDKYAADGNPDGLNDLGVDYATGHCTADATIWFHMAARQDHLEAAFNLGVVHATGCGGPRDFKTAAAFFKTAAEQGDTEAQYLTGSIYETGCGVPQSYPDAVKWYQRAAKAWHLPAQESLSRIYFSGLGTPPTAAETARWRSLSSAHKSDEAAYLLGVELANGTGMAPDLVEAAIWWRAAATQGHTAAAGYLGSLFLRGVGGGPPNPAEAAKCYGSAALRGDAQSQYGLGLAYAEKQNGWDGDLVQAWVWLDLAAYQGQQDAADKRDALIKDMTRPEFYAAQRLKREMMQMKGIVARRAN